MNSILQVSKGNDWTVVFFREVDISQPDFMKLSLFDVVVSDHIFLFFFFFKTVIVWVRGWTCVRYRCNVQLQLQCHRSIILELLKFI